MHDRLLAPLVPGKEMCCRFLRVFVGRYRLSIISALALRSIVGIAQLDVLC